MSPSVRVSVSREKTAVGLIVTNNHRIYSEKDVVDFYVNQTRLQLPEQSIFKWLKSDLSRFSMLDIGVGAGRTTLFFGGEVKEYIGIDNAQAMIDACEGRFGNSGKRFCFKVADVRNLEDFEDQHFDFILFSWNGLDVLEHAGRLRALGEIKRVLRPSGYFCFSSHNMQSVRRIKRVKWSLDWRQVRANLRKHFKFIRLNKITKQSLQESDHLIINEGAHNFGLRHYFVRPRHQLEQLRQAGFDNIRIVGLSDGKEVKEEDLSTNEDFWLYYLCRRKVE